MSQSNVGIRVNIDVSQARTQVQDLGQTIADLNREMQQAAEAKDWRSVAQLSQAIDNASSGRGQIMAQANQAQAQQAQLQSKDGLFGGMGMWILQTSLNQITQGILGAWDAALTAARQRASGDYTGAAVSQKRATGEIAGQAIGSAVGALGFFGGPMLGMMLVGLGGEIGRFLGGIGAKKMEEALAWSATYKSALPSIDSLNQLFGGAINRRSAEENNQRGIDMYERASGAARGTGLDTDQFISALGQTASYGIRDMQQALDMTRQQALWSRFTGTDMGAIQQLSGQAYRFGGETNAVSVAYGGLMAQDMGKGQFTEFLNSMGRILEDGISKGFVRSTEEIAGNMAMLFRLSGSSPLWQGEQGAQRLSQMNMAISSATNLQSVEDVITFSAARDILGIDDPSTTVNEREIRFRDLTGAGNVYTDTYVDIMQLLERGVSAELLQGQWGIVRQLDGDNTAAMIERFKTMYGLNYTGAAQVWDMKRNAWDSTLNDGAGGWREDFNAEEYAQNIRRLQETPEYRSDSQRLQDILNSIKNDGIRIGKIEFDNTELPAIQEAAEEIRDILRGKQGTINIAEAGETLINTLFTEEGIENINSVINPFGGGATARFALGMGDLIAAENKRNDPNAQAIGRRFNSYIVPNLSDNLSDDILNLLNELQSEFSKATKGIPAIFSEAGNRVGENENLRLVAILERLETALNTPLSLHVVTDE